MLAGASGLRDTAPVLTRILSLVAALLLAAASADAYAYARLLQPESARRGLTAESETARPARDAASASRVKEKSLAPRNSASSFSDDAWGNVESEQVIDGELTAKPNRIGFTGYQLDRATSEPGDTSYYAKARHYGAGGGSFLSVDPAAGDPLRAITYNRYLYGVANSAVYIDPSGRIEILANGAEQLADIDRFIADLGEQQPEGALGVVAAGTSGVARGFVKLSEGGLRLVNAAANTAVVASASVSSVFGYLPDYAEGAAGEMMSTESALRETGEYIAGGGVSKSYNRAVARTTDAFEGQPGAVSDVTSTLTQVGTAGAPAFRSGFSALRGAIESRIPTFNPSSIYTHGDDIVPRLAVNQGKPLTIGESSGPAVRADQTPAPAATQRPGTALQLHQDQIIINNYKRYYAEGWQRVVRKFNRGEITIPAGMSWRTVLGKEVDGFARMRLRRYLERERIPEGQGEDVLVNRWLRDPSGSGEYRIPDVRLRQTGTILDGTIGKKTLNTPQIKDMVEFSGGDRIMIVRPRSTLDSELQ